MGNNCTRKLRRCVKPMRNIQGSFGKTIKEEGRLQAWNSQRVVITLLLQCFCNTPSNALSGNGQDKDCRLCCFSLEMTNVLE